MGAGVPNCDVCGCEVMVLWLATKGAALGTVGPGPVFENGDLFVASDPEPAKGDRLFAALGATEPVPAFENGDLFVPCDPGPAKGDRFAGEGCEVGV